MIEEQKSRLFELADLILAVGRHIEASKEAEAESGTPLQGAVMRYIDRHPGTTARAAADATQLISSNFSRAVRGLEKAGLVRREVDQHDARQVHLVSTEKAQEKPAATARDLEQHARGDRGRSRPDRRRDLDLAAHRDSAGHPNPRQDPIGRRSGRGRSAFALLSRAISRAS